MPRVTPPAVEPLDDAGATVADGHYALDVAGGVTLGLVPAGGSGLTVQDENSNVSTAVTQIDFQGAGVTASAGTGEVVVTIPGGSGGSSVKDPRWHVLTGQTSIDEFNDSSLDAAWTRVDGTGAASANVTYTEDGDVLSVLNNGGDTASCIHGLVRPLSGAGGALAAGDGFVIQSAAAGPQANFGMFGLVLSDGTTFGAGNQVAGFAYMSGTAATAFNLDCRAFTSWNNNPTTVSAFAGTYQFCQYQRLALISANTWRHDFSPDGISWIKGSATLSKTMTATHVGFLSSSWGTSTKTVVGYEHIRRVAGVT